VSAQADTWREAPEEGDFNRLNSYVNSMKKCKGRLVGDCAIYQPFSTLFRGWRGIGAGGSWR